MLNFKPSTKKKNRCCMVYSITNIIYSFGNIDLMCNVNTQPCMLMPLLMIEVNKSYILLAIILGYAVSSIHMLIILLTKK